MNYEEMMKEAFKECRKHTPACSCGDYVCPFRYQVGNSIAIRCLMKRV